MTKTRSHTNACEHTEKTISKGKAHEPKGRKTQGNAVVQTIPNGKAQKPRSRKTSGNTVVQTTSNVAPYVPPKFTVQRAVGGLSDHEKGNAVLNIIEKEIPVLKAMDDNLYNSMDIIFQRIGRVFYTEFCTNGYPVCKLNVNFYCNTVELIRINGIPEDNAFLTIYYKMYLLIKKRLGFISRAVYDDRIAREKAEARRAEKANEPDGCGCFTPETLVPISNNGDITCRRIDELKSGHTLIGPEGTKQIVKHILKTRYAGTMISYNGLVGTPNHPIYVGGKWMPMKNVPGAVEIKDYSGFVYTFSVIGEDNTYATSFVANGQECAALGHGYTDEHCDSITHGALASTFWGKLILDIFESKAGKEIVDTNGVLTLDKNYELVRNASGWVTDLKIDC